jgi:hypothetical protein
MSHGSFAQSAHAAFRESAHEARGTSLPANGAAYDVQWIDGGLYFAAPPAFSPGKVDPATGENLWTLGEWAAAGPTLRIPTRIGYPGSTLLFGFAGLASNWPDSSLFTDRDSYWTSATYVRVNPSTGALDMDASQFVSGYAFDPVAHPALSDVSPYEFAISKLDSEAFAGVDPAALNNFTALGVSPDAAQARKWWHDATYTYIAGKVNYVTGEPGSEEYATVTRIANSYLTVFDDRDPSAWRFNTGELDDAEASAEDAQAVGGSLYVAGNRRQYDDATWASFWIVAPPSASPTTTFDTGASTRAVQVAGSFIYLMEAHRIVALNAAGTAIQWARTFPGSGTLGQLSSIATDGTDLYVAAEYGAPYYLYKLAGDDGEILWRR